MIVPVVGSADVARGCVHHPSNETERDRLPARFVMETPRVQLGYFSEQAVRFERRQIEIRGPDLEHLVAGE